jgi:hypothetical protein
VQTRAIPEDQWIEYFDRFSREHLGQPATIEVLDRQSGPQNVAANLPFQGISFDQAGTRACVIQVSAGDRADQHINHVVDMPLHIAQLEETNGSVDIEIEPERGPITLIRLQGPIH